MSNKFETNFWGEKFGNNLELETINKIIEILDEFAKRQEERYNINAQIRIDKLKKSLIGDGSNEKDTRLRNNSIAEFDYENEIEAKLERLDPDNFILNKLNLENGLIANEITTDWWTLIATIRHQSDEAQFDYWDKIKSKLLNLCA